MTNDKKSPFDQIFDNITSHLVKATEQPINFDGLFGGSPQGAVGEMIHNSDKYTSEELKAVGTAVHQELEFRRSNDPCPTCKGIESGCARCKHTGINLKKQAKT